MHVYIYIYIYILHSCSRYLFLSAAFSVSLYISLLVSLSRSLFLTFSISPSVSLSLSLSASRAVLLSPSLSIFFSLACLQCFKQLTPVGFEPTQLALVELESTPLDHSGKVSICLSLGMPTKKHFLLFHTHAPTPEQQQQTQEIHHAPALPSDFFSK